ncbi:nitroreductase family deazaflavin-dependent oxidoreductase [Kribbella sp. NBC_01245]|uniref:nitroreductase family deazaflavin-dependent oxidoreductase n=1 Tax=Kribbella sp. NBC_01245 TaxID=2903578 RepID=UPI002E2DD90E|nr:nitroreductase family deazaflavin-dependent oxidoreductase [Kribbella sp. NBC_01245]
MAADNENEYEPSPAKWVRDQVRLIEESGGTKGTSAGGKPVILLTMRGAKSGLIRKVPLMRIEHDRRYVAVGSNGGSVKPPAWVANLLAGPRVTLQDGPERLEVVARLLAGDERAEWWERAVEGFRYYAGYQKKVARELPVFLLEPMEPSESESPE